MNSFAKRGSALALLAAVIFLLAASPERAAAEPSLDVLKESINTKTAELKEINKQIQETQGNITTLEQQARTLKRDIKRYNYQINQLSLTIKSSEFTIEKLGFEIQSLELDIAKRETDIKQKRKAIADFLRKIQELDSENTLMILLRNSSLAESVADVESLTGLSDGLNREISDLERTKISLANTRELELSKRSATEREAKNLKNRRAITENQKSERHNLLTSTNNQEQQYQAQLTKLAKQQNEIALEIEAIEKKLRAKINTTLLPIPRPGVLAWPINGGTITQRYGATTFARKNYPGKHHNGIDIGAPIGTEVYASESGTVTFATNQDRYCPRGAYGRVVVIAHENGLSTLYGHLSRYIVSQGQRVERGQLIGYVGRSGWSTGSHLHFTVWETSTFILKATRYCGLMPVGGDIDPLLYTNQLINH